MCRGERADPERCVHVNVSTAHILFVYASLEFWRKLFRTGVLCVTVCVFYGGAVRLVCFSGHDQNSQESWLLSMIAPDKSQKPFGLVAVGRVPDDATRPSHARYASKVDPLFLSVKYWDYV